MHPILILSPPPNRLLALLFILSLVAKQCQAKGAATRGAAAGGGAGVTAGEGGSGQYTEQEMEAALVILCMVLLLFCLICASQCFQRVAWEFIGRSKATGNNGKRPMPMAPYVRDSSSTSNPAPVPSVINAQWPV